jgi:hypothetical protein
MSARNWPAGHRLDGRGGPDERARRPEELLDNLRLRLSQLAANHPSAPGEGNGHGERVRDRYPAEPDEGWPDEGWPDDSRRGENQPGAEEPESVPGQDPASQGGPGGGQRGPAADSLRPAAGPGVLATMQLPGRGRDGGQYRPWFMAGEPGSPWWAGTLY